MKAEIQLTGPVRYGQMWELQAQITCADSTIRSVKWSLHHIKMDAEEYRDNFNSNEEEVEKPCPMT